MKFICESHRIKVKVAGAKKVKKLFPQYKTLIGNNSGYKTELQSLRIASNGVFGYGGSNGVTAVFVT